MMPSTTKKSGTTYGSPQLVPRSIKRKKFGTEFDDKKKTLVLDLDQTLVYLTMDTPSKEVNFVEIPDQGKIRSYAIRRPGLDQFMREMCPIYNICIYTANKPRYAVDVVKAVGLTPYIFEVYTREHCTKISERMYMKSLMNLGFSFSYTVFVDDSAVQMRSQPLNGVLIQAFKGELSDCALIYLSPFLKYISTLNDVRPVTERLFNYYNQGSQTPKKRSSSKTKKTGPKATHSDELPLINEENEDEDDKPRIIRKKATTLGTDGLRADGMEAFRAIYGEAKTPSSQLKRSVSLPSHRQLEKMYSQSGPGKFGTLKRSDSLTEV